MNAWTYRLLMVATWLATNVALAATPEGAITDYLVVPKIGEYGKAPLHRDPIDATIASGAWKAPSERDTITAADGAAKSWARVTTNPRGALNDRQLAGGYAFATVDSPNERVMILKARRHAAVCVNGEWLAGDPYDYGFVELPVLLKQGVNEFLFHVARPGMRAELVTPSAEHLFIKADAVTPNVVRGETDALWASLTVANASRSALVGAQIAAKIGDDAPMVTGLSRIEPLSVQKIKFRLTPPEAVGDTIELRVALVKPAAKAEEAAEPVVEDSNADAPRTEPELDVLATEALAINVVAPGQLATHTFVSGIDGSVQRYSVLPASQPASEETTGMVLTLHDFGVDSLKHVQAYEAKPWAHLIAPHGRRRFGFDWEDWSAADAIEALEAARARYPSNPRRTYLTGVGLGGHGAWLLGAKQPSRFAAIGPVGGWLSYWSYGGGMPAYDDPSPVEQMLVRAASPSDTLALLRNLASTSVYVLHDAEDRLVSQSRFARRRLGDFHTDFVYYERTGATKSAGSPDWPGMMRFFRTRESPRQAEVTRIDFATNDPGQAARCHWASIEAQDSPLTESRVVLGYNPKNRSFAGRTENVACLTLDVSHLPSGKKDPIMIQLDGSPRIKTTRPEPVRGKGSSKLWLAKDKKGRWRTTPPGTRTGVKTSVRQGSFKSVFNRNAVLVYGTSGSPEENQWAVAKARYDAQMFWVRGGGSLEVVPDTEFNAVSNVNRNVVLYGNADTNRAWPALLSTSPVQIRQGQAYVGVRPEEGDDLGVLMVRPRRNSSTALVGVVGGSGIKGMRLTNRLRYFFSGIAYPDLLLLGGRAATEGASGVRATGYFGHDWSIDQGEIVWRDLAL